ncbi:MAG: ribonuclease HI, partial [Bdellovibrio sp. CG_4_9_14_3_um_filter_39_7]
MAVAIFSDGACRGNPGVGAWACMAQNAAGEILFESSGVDANTTNNRMELEGVISGLKYL